MKGRGQTPFFRLPLGIANQRATRRLIVMRFPTSVPVGGAGELNVYVFKLELLLNLEKGDK